MRPILFPSNETSFTSNGLGRLDPISCTVTEERNGQYELEMVVSIEDQHYGDIEEGRLLLVRHDETTDTQPFEIYYISRPLDGQVTVLAHHISYRTATITVMPFEASSITAAMLALKSNSVGDNPFNLSTTKVVSRAFKVTEPSTLRSLLAGEAGSLLDVYGKGEYEWDRFNIKLHLNRGQETTVVLRYGKDITELKKTTDISSIWTGVVPYWLGTDPEDPDTEVLVTLPEQVLYASNVSDYTYRMVVPLDMSSSFQEQPTVAQLRAAAQSYISENVVTGIPTSIDVSFVNLAQVEEYENVAALQRLRLCDTLTIVHSKLGISVKAKIVKVVYDVLLEQYVTMTVGDVRSNLETTLSKGLKSSVDDLRKKLVTKYDYTSGLSALRNSLEDEMASAISDQTDKILGGSGGYVVIRMDADDKPREILVMDTDNMNTATNVLRINMNGIGFSSTGINGPYTSAWTLDGQFVADFIRAGTLTATLIRAGILTDVNGINYWNLETGEFRLASTTTVGGSTVASIAEGKANAAASALDNALTQQAIFNRLTNNGQTQGIYLKNGLLYINGTYIDTGVLNAALITTGEMSADRISGGTLILGGSNNANGALTVKDASGNIIGTWNNNGLTLNKGSISLNSGAFAVTNAGALTASNASLKGSLQASGTDITGNTINARIASGKIRLYGDTNDGDVQSWQPHTYLYLRALGGSDPSADISSATSSLDISCSGLLTEHSGTLTLGASDGDYEHSSERSVMYIRAAEINITSNYRWLHNNAPHVLIRGKGMYESTGSETVDFNVMVNVNSDAYVSGSVSVSGTKSRVVTTDQYAERLLYCYETASPMFGDIGEGLIGEDGKCYVWLDPVFAQTIATDQYQVFLQRYGDGDIYVSERRGACFVVTGTPGMTFGWEVKAKQKGYDQKRLDRMEDIPQMSSIDYGESAAQYISTLQEGRLAS